MINLFSPFVPKDAIDEVVNTLNTRWIGQGWKVDKFEKEFSEKFNQRYCVSLNSGSAALETAYELADIKEGDEVISTPLTCTATNIPLLRMGAKIIWADIDPKNLCLDPKDVRRKISARTKAIVNVHLGGIENDLGDMPVPVVADACQALGVFNGTFTCNSFQAIKHITTGDGGMLVCPGIDQYKQAKLMRWFGIDREKKMANGWQAYKERQMTFDIETIGYKRQMTDIAAGMGMAGLRHYGRIIAHLEKLFSIYEKELAYTDGIRLVKPKNGCRNTYWLCQVLVNDRDDFALMLHDAGVETNLVQVRNDAFRIFKDTKRDDLPVMDAIEGKYICLPINMMVTEEDVYYICEKVKNGWQGYKK